jgi:hypothetical protein
MAYSADLVWVAISTRRQMIFEDRTAPNCKGVKSVEGSKTRWMTLSRPACGMRFDGLPGEHSARGLARAIFVPTVSVAVHVTYDPKSSGTFQSRMLGGMLVRAAPLLENYAIPII